MVDFQSFKHGSATFPLELAVTTGNSFLRDADPCVFYALEFFASVLNTHLSDRLLEESAAIGMTRITDAVAETVPYDPAAYLTETQAKFPLLAVYRKGTKPIYQGNRKQTVDHLECVYVLPPLEAGEAERLLPALKAVHSVIDNRAEQGFDPSYTPSSPTGTPGERVWSADRAGAVRIDVGEATFGAYAVSSEVVMPCVTIAFTLQQRYEVVASELQEFAGASVSVDHVDLTTETTEQDFIQFETQPELTVTAISPDTGSKAGGTSITVTYSGDLGTDLPTVKVGNVACTSVTVVNSTTITAVTGAHYVFGSSLIADVTVTNSDGQVGTLAAGFTYTTP